MAQAPITMNAGSAQLEWQAAGPGSLFLSVNGPGGFHMDQRFAQGEAALFSVFDESGNLRPAGGYTFEVRIEAVVDDATRAELDAIRANGGEGNVGALQKAGKIPAQPAVYSGYFTIAGGTIEFGGEEEAGAGPAAGGNQISAKDQVILDDLIVDGSICVGFDCVNGENFGFDTLRLKENNTRIKFQDTSTGSFPSTDWQLTANDSTNGGANRFSIEDIDAGRTPFTIEASAPSNSLYVDDGGRVGLGTATPVVNLHTVSGNTPTLRLEQNGSSGFTPQTWDVAGNETNFFVRDVTNGSKLPFRIKPSAPTNSIYIDTDGDVGLGTASPSAALHLTRSNDTAKILIQDTNATESVNEMLELKNNGGVRYRLTNDTDATQWDISNDGNGDFAVSLVGSGGNELEVEQDGDIGNCGNPDHDFVISTGPGCTATPRSWIDAGDTSFSTSSSRTYKENLKAVRVDNILNTISEIPVYNYDFINGPKDRIGLVAEDFYRVFGRGSGKELSGQEVQVAMWLAIQELIAQNKTLQDEVSTLQQALEQQ